MPSIPPPDELTRLRILADYGVMDTGPDETLEEIVALAATICGVPIALVSLVDETRQWFKARVGLDATQTPRDVAFCAHAIAQPEEALFTVRDARVDPRFRDNPLVRSDPHVVFYAGAPLSVEEGARLGTLCVIDHEPRVLSAMQERALATLSRLVVRHLKARREAQERLAQEAFHRTVLASIGDAVLAADLDGRVTFLNAAAEGLTGWTLAEACGRPLEEVFRVVAEPAHALAASPVTPRSREGDVVGATDRALLLRRDGSPVPVEEGVAPVSPPDRPPTGVVLVFRDATETRRIEAERERLLTRSQAALGRSDFLLRVAQALGAGLELEPLLRRLVEAIVPSRADFASVWTVDDDGRCHRQVHVPFAPGLARPDIDGVVYPPNFPIRWVASHGHSLVLNELDAWLRAAGLDAIAQAVDALGLGHALYLPIRRGPDVAAVLAVSRRAGTPFTEEDGELFSAAAAQASLALENARLHGETLLLREAAEQATLAKDHFLARVSHDLRNPLHSILGWTALLRDRSSDVAQVVRGVDVIERNARAQVQLVEDLLDVARIAEGKLSLSLAPVPVSAAIDAALDAARLAAKARGVDLATEVGSEVGSVALDADRFRQIVWNLASNAVKFTARGGTVRVDVRRDGGQLVVRVTDTGRGIAPTFLPQVFERFEQSDEGTRRGGGLGLGLNITRQLVELHGGTIGAESEGEGRGACFTVRLPIRESLPPAVG